MCFITANAAKTMGRLRIYVLMLVLFSGQKVFCQTSHLLSSDSEIRARLDSMTLDQKIGQLFIIGFFNEQSEAEKQILLSWIEKYQIGGICLFSGNPEKYAQAVHTLQQKSKIPLFVTIDGEWGLGMRYKGEAISFPRQLMLGAIQDEKLIYEMGREIGRQCKKMGINVNFSPSVDLNSNLKNPVINERSFGEHKENVTSKAYMYMKGLEDEGILACAKHFPGHGDTYIDSHRDLPVIYKTREALESYECYPFIQLAKEGLSSIMIGHLAIPAMDNRPERPASLSRKIVHDYLRRTLGFEGLIMTDALDMKAVSRKFILGEAEAEALAAGNDILLLPKNFIQGVETIKRYMREGKITESEIDEHVIRILRYKHLKNIQNGTKPADKSIYKSINGNKAKALKFKLIEKAITLVSNQDSLLPFRNISTPKTATISFNVINESFFQKRISDYANVRHYQIMPQTLASKKQSLINTFLQFDRIIIGIHSSIKNYSISRDLPEKTIEFLRLLDKEKEVVICVFGHPLLLSRLEGFRHVMLCYDNESMIQDIAAQSIFGAITIEGKIPLTIGNTIRCGSGIQTTSLQRLGYAIPEYVGMSSDSLRQIEWVMSAMMSQKAAPGAQILVARNNKIIFSKSYGRTTYKGIPVGDHTVYDLASVTKILGPTLGIMKLYEEGRIDLSQPLSRYVDEALHTNKDSLIISDILAHQSGLRASIPFYRNTLMSSGKRKKIPDPDIYSNSMKDDYIVPVANGLFMKTGYQDTIWKKIFNSRLLGQKEYQYSDLGFFLMHKLLEKTAHDKMDTYLQKHFYNPLDLQRTGFKPIEKIPLQEIAPTEEDRYFRNSKIHGTVHDMTAAMFGGVAGNAGLFSNARETAVIMQMLLNKGTYGGRRFLMPETVNLFTTRHPSSSRRGLGFDLKELDSKKHMNMSRLASEETFGHTGFTGTAAYADPANQLIFVVCTNRTYPYMRNNTFNSKGYRKRLQTIIYKSLYE